MDVFVVEHVYVEDDEEHVKLIGVYSSKEAADAAIQRLKAQPGFCDTPNGFSVDRHRVDQDSWPDGFLI